MTLLSILLAQPATAADCDCPPLGAPATGDTIVSVTNLSELQAAIASASGPTTIYLEDGVYAVTTESFVNVYRDDITIRSQSGNRTAVIIEGQGMAAPGKYGHGFFISNGADNVTIADLTVRQVQHHGIFVNPGSDNCSIYNVHVYDTGEQLIKASGLEAKRNGSIACSLISYTTTLDDGADGWYTNGVDLIGSQGWTIRNNTFRNIQHNPSVTTQLAGPAILVWQGSSDTIVEGNRIIDCDRGIAFGDSSGSGVQHTGGIIRNNTIKGHSGSDVGIGVARSVDAVVEHNTIYSPGGPYSYSIEADHSETTGCIIRNNFTDEPFWADRRGAVATVSGNRNDAQASDFRNAAAGDLHLATTALTAIDTATVISERVYDMDCDAIGGAAPDLGADEWQEDGDIHEDPSDPMDPADPEDPADLPSTGSGSGHGSGCLINTAGGGFSQQ